MSSFEEKLTVPADRIAEIEQILAKIGVPAPPCVESTRKPNNLHERYKHVEDSQFKRNFLRSICGNIQDRINTTKTCTLRKDEVLDDSYLRDEQTKTTNPQVRNMMAFRRKLPAWDKREEILQALSRNRVILITGETGCGKTTQVAQFILENAIAEGRGSQTSIVCTQPRRISAISVAERVANERGERLGRSVGYQIRLEKVLPRSSGSILFCTTGVLLQHMHGDPLLTKVSTVIVDEIHERNTVSDFTITILKEIIPLRPDLTVILMSATLNAERFSKYFNNCPTVHIPGFTFSVEEFFLEDVLKALPHYKFPVQKQKIRAGKDLSTSKAEDGILQPYYRELLSGNVYSPRIVEQLKNPASDEIQVNLVVELIAYICKEKGPGAILVFLPGWDKISAVNKAMSQSGMFPQRSHRIIPLHSQLPTANQKEVFDRPPQGVRKIILATNIAETSITIDDVVFVIDCGKIKIKNFDVSGNVSTLKEEWVSLANARQRRGRAGRVQKGTCYHLYSKGRALLLEQDMLPEMLRTRLEEVILQGKILQVGKIHPFLKKVMDPPSERSVELSLSLLKGMNALDSEENLTPLGYHLASLPLDPQVGKMLLYAALFKCLDPVASVAAALSYKDPFVIPLGSEREVDKVRQSFDAGHKSDHLILAKVMAQFEDANANRSARQYAKSNFMSLTVLEQLFTMKQQFAKLLHEMKFAPDHLVKSHANNINTENISLVRAIVCSGLFPNVAKILKTKKAGKHVIQNVQTIDNQKVDFHPKSVFSKMMDFNSSYVVYFERIKSSKIYLYDSTMIYPMSMVFFCHDLQVFAEPDHKIIKAGEYMLFHCSNELARIIVELRSWLDWLVEYRMCHPGVVEWKPDSDEALILDAIARLIAVEESMATGEFDDSEPDHPGRSSTPESDY